MKRRKLPRNVVSHGDGFRARVQVEGRRVYGPVVRTPAEAAESAAKLRGRDPADRDVTVEDAFQLVLDACEAAGRSPATVAFYTCQYRGLTRVLRADAKLSHLRPPQLRELVAERRKDGIGAGTIRHELGVLRRMFRLAIREGLATETPFDRFDMPSHRARTTKDYTGETIGRIVAWMRENGSTWQADVVEVLFLTGMRRSELVRLDPARDINWTEGVLSIRGKTRNRRLVVGESVLAPLRRLADRGLESGRLVADAEQVAGVFKRSRPQLVRAGLIGPADQWSAHVMRHSAATEMVSGGVSLADAQHVLGHSSPTMTSRYFHGRDDAARRALDAVDRSRRSPEA
jgi:integrase/recombinase XerC